MILESIIASLIPAGVDITKQIVNKLTGTSSVADTIKMRELDIEQQKAMAELDRPADNTPSWVSAVRALLRPLICYLVLTVFAFFVGYLAYTSQLNQVWVVEKLFDLTGAVVFFALGERMNMYLSGTLKK